MNPALNNFYYNILTTYTDKITKIFLGDRTKFGKHKSSKNHNG